MGVSNVPMDVTEPVESTMPITAVRAPGRGLSCQGSGWRSGLGRWSVLASLHPRRSRHPLAFTSGIGNVDATGLRLRLPRSATKRDRARWVYLPEWLMQAIEATCALEDRTPERKVFQGITEASAYHAMTRACRYAKVPHYHPHDLRHRRITVWHQSGVPARELAERAPAVDEPGRLHARHAGCRRG